MDPYHQYLLRLKRLGPKAVLKDYAVTVRVLTLERRIARTLGESDQDLTWLERDVRNKKAAIKRMVDRGRIGPGRAPRIPYLRIIMGWKEAFKRVAA